MSYKIIVSFQSSLSSEALASKMQKGYDTNGVAGMFLFDGNGPEKVCTFHRETEDDRELVKARVSATATEVDYQKAVVAQLFAELTACDPAEEVLPVIEALKSGSATVKNVQEIMAANGIRNSVQNSRGPSPGM